MKKLCVAMMLSLFVVASFGTAYAQGFRCGSLYVSVGQHKEGVWNQCGSPNSRSNLGYDSKGSTTVKLEKWGYVRGGYVYVLYIRNSRVEKIEKIRRK